MEGEPQAETPENFQAALDLLLRAILPVKAGEKIKRELCKTKKPMSMDVTTFVAMLKKINKFIRYCPGDVPELSSEELQGVLEQSVQNSWRTDLLKRTDYESLTLDDVRDYFKLLEGLDDETNAVKHNGPNAGHLKRSGRARNFG